MREFIEKHSERICRVLSGLDRVRFRGTFRNLAVPVLMMKWLSHRNVLLKDFKPFARPRWGGLQRVPTRGFGGRAIYPRPRTAGKDVGPRNSHQLLSNSRRVSTVPERLRGENHD